MNEFMNVLFGCLYMHICIYVCVSMCLLHSDVTLSLVDTELMLFVGFRMLYTLKGLESVQVIDLFHT